jgi:hypothetical protein
MHTRAKIELDGTKAMLVMNGKRLRASIESPAGASFGVVSADAPKPQAQQAEVTNLIVNVGVAAGSTEIRIVFDLP